jgi:hypothetical protein
MKFWRLLTATSFPSVAGNWHNVLIEAGVRQTLNKSPQRAITRTQAVCGVEFLANIQILARNLRWQAHPDPGAARFCGDLFSASLGLLN